MSRPIRSVSIIALLTAAPLVGAQAQGQAGLEEITVTARRVEENLMQVPMAITAVTAASIENAGVQDIFQLSQFTPGLFASVNNNGRVDRSAHQLTFRGLSVASGLLFIDGVPYGASNTPDLTAVERVEVLKGPQSAYFGRATFSGAVNFVTKDPSDKASGEVRGEYGSFDTNTELLSLEGPLAGDRLGVRATYRHFGTGGQYTNYGNPVDRMGRQDTNALTISMVAKPTDSLKANTFFSWARDEDGVPNTAALKASGPFGIHELNCNLNGTGGPYWCGALPKFSDLDRSIVSVYDIISPLLESELFQDARGYPLTFDPYFNHHFGFSRTTAVAHLKLDYETASGWDLVSTTAWDKTKFGTVVDQSYRDGSPRASNIPNALYPSTPFAPPFRNTTLLQQSLVTEISQELRVTTPQKSRLRGTLGANDFVSWNKGPTNFGISTLGRLTQFKTTNNTNTYAVFGGLYYDLTDELTLSAEARYQWDHIQSQTLYPNFGPRVQGTFTSFSPRVTMDYKYAPNQLLYGLWSVGYRPGGFNSTLVGLSQFVLNQFAVAGASVSYAQEKLNNFEVGHKGTWLDGHLRTTLAAYYDMWTNGQVSNSVFANQPDGSTIAATLTTNQGKVRLYGVELEADAALTAHLTLSATLDYEHTEILSYIFLPNGPKIYNSANVTGHALAQAPDWTWSLSPTYTDHLSGDWDWFARLDYRHRGRIFVDATNVAWLRPLDLVNTHLGVQRDNLKIEFYITNLLDNKNLTDAVYGPEAFYSPTTNNEIRIGLPDRRQLGLKATYKF